jgi:hypothetical protein
MKNFIGKFVHVFVDDVLIYSKILTQYYKHLELVIKALAENGFKVNIKKSEFGMESLDYLGFKITKNRILLQEAQVNAIPSSPLPFALLPSPPLPLFPSNPLPSAPLPLCPSAPLPLCPAAPLPLCPSAPLPLYPSAPLHLCPSAPLLLCPSAPLPHQVLVTPSSFFQQSQFDPVVFFSGDDALYLIIGGRFPQTKKSPPRKPQMST